jgi:hypothetical protein
MHLVRNKMAKTYFKCALRRATWTGGAGTDVRVRDPACAKWMSGEEAWDIEQKRRQASLNSEFS